MTNKTGKEDNRYKPVFIEQQDYLDLLAAWGDTPLDEPEVKQILANIVGKALARKEEKMIKLFKECLPEGEVSVCSKHKSVKPYCDICGRVYGHNSCLSQIKQKAKDKYGWDLTNKL